MRASSLKTIAKPQRGGVPNALFVWASVESLPAELLGIAHEITINYPWGSLLKALITPEMEVLRGIAQLARPGVSLAILINYSVFEDADYRQKLSLPDLTLERAKTTLSRDYREAGLEVKSVKLLDGVAPHTTTWGLKLTKGSGSRKTLAIEAIMR